VVKVRGILGDLRSRAQKFGYRQILGPVTLSNAKNISGGSIRGPEIYRNPPLQILYFNYCMYIVYYDWGPFVPHDLFIYTWWFHLSAVQQLKQEGSKFVAWVQQASSRRLLETSAVSLLRHHEACSHVCDVITIYCMRHIYLFRERSSSLQLPIISGTYLWQLSEMSCFFLQFAALFFSISF